MQALCRSYLRAPIDLYNWKKSEQTKTKIFIAAMKVFSYFATAFVLPVGAALIYGVCFIGKKISKISKKATVVPERVVNDAIRQWADGVRPLAEAAAAAYATNGTPPQGSQDSEVETKTRAEDAERQENSQSRLPRSESTASPTAHTTMNTPPVATAPPVQLPPKPQTQQEIIKILKEAIEANATVVITFKKGGQHEFKNVHLHYPQDDATKDPESACGNNHTDFVKIMNIKFVEIRQS